MHAFCFPSQFLIPVELVVDCQADMLDAYGRSALVKDFALLHGVLVRLNDKNSGLANSSVTLRGNQQELHRLRDALQHLMKLCNISVSYSNIACNNILQLRVLTRVQNGLVSMKMEVSTENFRTMEANLRLLENSYGVVFHVFQLTHEREDHQAVWIRGSLEGTYQAKMALMVTENPNLAMPFLLMTIAFFFRIFCR
jgi:hypothetical protein